MPAIVRYTVTRTIQIELDAEDGNTEQVLARAESIFMNPTTALNTGFVWTKPKITSTLIERGDF